MTVFYLPFIDCSKEVQLSACSYVNTCFFGIYNQNNMTVAILNEKVIGILIYGEPTRYYKSIAGEHSVYLLHLKVSEDYRRRGIATTLVNETLARLKRMNLFIEVKLPKEGIPDVCPFIKSFKKVKELPAYSFEKETYMRYILEYESDGSGRGEKAATP